ncbi:hypothetical protein [Paraburkholderia fungorum]|uniref:Uncharacterized protein n=1 Tax=Paraburkholderia fungorum TaxID=134537 RepID=A0AAW3V2G1_9BURK|nr:hypothetical protein [Paraburkholderia fungorum]MBB4516479.1 hypothetical protein [Paraburkholderia fungorum]MBB5545264.1 hypothetical protein [Paraburkholderia fungorum]MBB6205048.1 hypothetical protein [Paraburkholderia fungorum]MBU7440659.1 hypothetical protein [Paraburkholderia fungorum]MDE1007198.1 hypothetical protein [Paraburkholderia fungorum]
MLAQLAGAGANLDGLTLLALWQLGSRPHSQYQMTEIDGVSQERLKVVDRHIGLLGVLP